MSLMKKGTSLATLEANRANARKRAGATTGRGKAVSRSNAVRHRGRASVMFDLMPAPGEAPEDFAAALALEAPPGSGARRGDRPVDRLGYIEGLDAA
jgi:hypothetical protein